MCEMTQPVHSLPDVLCDPTDLMWREGTPFEGKTGHTAFIYGLLAEIFQGFLQLLKYNYLFWLITFVPFKIGLKSFPRGNQKSNYILKSNLPIGV